MYIKKKNPLHKTQLAISIVGSPCTFLHQHKKLMLGVSGVILYLLIQYYSTITFKDEKVTLGQEAALETLGLVLSEQMCWVHTVPLHCLSVASKTQIKKQGGGGGS